MKTNLVLNNFLFSACNLAKLTVETEDMRSAVAPDPIPMTGESTANARALSRCKAMSGSFQRGRFQVCVFGLILIYKGFVTGNSIEDHGL